MFLLGLYFLDKRAEKRQQDARDEREQGENENMKRIAELIENLSQSMALPTDQRSQQFETSVSNSLYRRCLTLLTRFRDLWLNYKIDHTMRIHRLLENEIRTLGVNIVSLAAEATAILPNEDVDQIKEVGFQLRKLGEWLGTIGDGEAFTSEGESVLQKSEQLRQRIVEKPLKFG